MGTIARVCAKTVARHEPADSARKGTFSNKSRRAVPRANRPSGQASSNSRTNGSVTSDGFASSPAAKQPRAARYQRPGRAARV